MSSDIVLSVAAVDSGYGAVPILHDVSIQARRGEITAILGRNGAGKSTLMKTVSGLVRPTAGTVTLNGARVDGKSAVQIARAGLQYVAEGHRVFRSQDVMTNLELGLYRTKISRSDRASRLDRIFELFPDLNAMAARSAGLLSGGQQQMLAIAQALMREPDILLVDEPSLGLAPVVIDSVFETLRRLRAEGVTILLVEQIVNKTLEAASYGYVLRDGQVAAEGRPEELRQTDALKDAYMGATT